MNYTVNMMNEAIQMAEETRDYISAHRNRMRNKLDGEKLMKLGHIQAQITARIVTCVAWLLSQQAVLSQELTLEQSINDGYFIDTHELLSIERESWVPKKLQDLSSRSDNLYNRIKRLNTQVRENYYANN